MSHHLCRRGAKATCWSKDGQRSTFPYNARCIFHFQANGMHRVVVQGSFNCLLLKSDHNILENYARFTFSSLEGNALLSFPAIPNDSLISPLSVS